MFFFPLFLWTRIVAVVAKHAALVLSGDYLLAGLADRGVHARIILHVHCLLMTAKARQCAFVHGLASS